MGALRHSLLPSSSPLREHPQPGQQLVTLGQVTSLVLTILMWLLPSGSRRSYVAYKQVGSGTLLSEAAEQPAPSHLPSCGIQASLKRCISTVCTLPFIVFFHPLSLQTALHTAAFLRTPRKRESSHVILWP